MSFYKNVYKIALIVTLSRSFSKLLKLIRGLVEVKKEEKWKQRALKFLATYINKQTNKQVKSCGQVWEGTPVIHHYGGRHHE